MKKSKTPQPAKKVRRSGQAGGKAQSLPLILDQSAGDPILVFDLDGRVTHANNTAQTCFKITERDFVGRHFHDFVHPHSLSKFQAAFDQATESMNQGGVELEGVTSKKERIPFEVTFAPVMQGGKVCAVHTIGRDLRPRRRLEQLTVEAEKMKAVQLFVRGTALELRNPLLGVLRQSESLVKEYAKRDFEYIGFREFSEIMSNLESISEQIKYCYSTVERLVKLNQRRVRLKKSFCHPHDVIEELVILKEEQLRANNIRLNVQLATRLPSIAIGEIDFNQIMTNLFNNAIEAMPGGGVLTIKTSYLKKTQQVRITIHDEGIGIAKENIPHVFDPFFTTKQRGVGRNSGLGLTIVYALIKDYHGEITVDSSLRKGTMVQVSFAAKKAKA